MSQVNELLGASHQLSGILERTIRRFYGRSAHAAADTTEAPRRRSRATGEVAPRQFNPHPENVTPEFLRWLCKTLAYTPAATAENSLGIAGFANEFPSPSDLRLFMGAVCEDAVDATYTVEQVYGGLYDPSHPGYEASLDVQYTGGLAYTTPVVYYSICGNLQRTSKMPRCARTCFCRCCMAHRSHIRLPSLTFCHLPSH